MALQVPTFAQYFTAAVGPGITQYFGLFPHVSANINNTLYLASGQMTFMDAGPFFTGLPPAFQQAGVGTAFTPPTAFNGIGNQIDPAFLAALNGGGLGVQPVGGGLGGGGVLAQPGGLGQFGGGLGQQMGMNGLGFGTGLGGFSGGFGAGFGQGVGTGGLFF
jgi:hypothetical protein